MNGYVPLTEYLFANHLTASNKPDVGEESVRIGVIIGLGWAGLG